MSKIIKRRYRISRSEFKKELSEKCKENKVLAMLLIETYVAWHHRRHIIKIWGMFKNPNFQNFREAYSQKLFGKHLTGRSDVWRFLYFTERELRDKYRKLIPEVFAMGDAYDVALQTLKS